MRSIHDFLLSPEETGILVPYGKKDQNCHKGGGYGNGSAL